MVGTPTKSLPALTRTVKGFRPGELVVFTGPTGTVAVHCTVDSEGHRILHLLLS
jgi:hypothetical protein